MVPGTNVFLFPWKCSGEPAFIQKAENTLKVCCPNIFIRNSVAISQMKSRVRRIFVTKVVLPKAFYGKSGKEISPGRSELRKKLSCLRKNLLWDFFSKKIFMFFWRVRGKSSFFRGLLRGKATA
jgi:hypothetical protein